VLRFDGERAALFPGPALHLADQRARDALAAGAPGVDPLVRPEAVPCLVVALPRPVRASINAW
jgi:hypothetical protein